MLIVMLTGWHNWLPGMNVAGPLAVASTPSIAPSSASSPPPHLMNNLLPNDYRLIDITTIAPDIQLDMRYATANNFLKQVVYSKARCLLRDPVARSLQRAQANLKTKGYGLKLYDCYRPLSVQKAMWKIFPDGRYVANPATGSRHNRGAAVDLTLVDAQGVAVEMPSEFDDFSERAYRDSPTMTAAARQHVQILTDALEAQGFTTIASEWWHYDGPQWTRYGILSQGL
jgi:zinc D-Ala-D-Ala dipeptidase